MFPVGDEIPRLGTPWMTAFIVAGMFAVWVLVQGAGLNERVLVTSVCNLGMVPGELTHLAPLGTAVPVSRDLACVVDNDPVNVLTPLISLFLHGGWGHILGNALFLWVFGRGIEAVMGPSRYLLFYLICGLAAAAVHVAVAPASPIPTVGASGAISGVMGAYLVLYPRVRVRMFFYFLIFFKVIPLPAWLVLLWWFGLQLLTGLPQILSPSPEIAGGGGVAVWAHVGGFVAGVILVKWFERPGAARALRRRYGPRTEP